MAIVQRLVQLEGSALDPQFHGGRFMHGLDLLLPL